MNNKSSELRIEELRRHGYDKSRRDVEGGLSGI
jgi:hypothetical protein